MKAYRSSERSGAFKPLQVLLIIAILALIAWSLIPIVALDPGGPAMATRCQSNVKQQTTALLIYAADHDDRLPTRDSWMDALLPFVKSEQIFHCPAVQESNQENPHLFGYAFNSRLSGVEIESIDRPETVPMTYDSINMGRNASDPIVSLPSPPRVHDDKACNLISYLDTRTDRVTNSP